MEKSVYKRVINSLSEYDEILPNYFSSGSLAVWKDVTEVDGELYSLSEVYAYPQVNPEDVIRMFKLVSEDRVDEALTEEKTVFSDGRLLSIVNENRLLKFFGKNRDQICQENMISFLKNRLTETIYPEEIRILLMWCMYLDSYDEELQKILMTFALDTEFSDQCYQSIWKFPNGNESLFTLIQRKSQKDRINAIRIMKLDDYNKKHWLLYHTKLLFGGNLEGEYAAFIADQCDFISMLKDTDLKSEDFDKIREFTWKIFWDNPEGRSLKLSDLKTICGLIAERVRENPTGNGIEDIVEIRKGLIRINKMDRNMYPMEDVIEFYDQALQDQKVVSCAEKAVRNGENLTLSTLFNVSYDENTVLKKLKQDFCYYYKNINYLTNPVLIREAITEMCSKINLISKDCMEDRLVRCMKTACADLYLEAYVRYHLDDDPDVQFQNECESIFMKYSSIYDNSQIYRIQKPFSYWVNEYRRRMTSESDG